MKFRNGFAALAVFGLLCCVGMATGAHAQAIGTPLLVPSDENLITVSGTGEVQAAPDIARVSLGVVTQNADAARASAENATKSAALVAAMKTLGVAEKDIQTTGYNINPQYDYSTRKPGDNRPPQIVGYQVSNTVRVTVRKIADVGRVVDAGVKAGANNADGIVFDLNDDTRARAQTDALKRAVANARSKADALAQAVNVAAFSLFSISEAGYSGGPVRPEGFQTMNRLSVAAPTTPVQAGELTVSATVTVKYRMRQ